jgi:hypothetical protein
MKPQQISIKHSALGWVKQSIDDNLTETARDLDLYLEGREAYWHSHNFWFKGGKR